MDIALLLATTCAGLSLVGHLASSGLAALRLSRPAPTDTAAQWPAVTLIRPVCGLDDVERETIASTFRLMHTRLEILFCACNASDRAVSYVRALIEQHPHLDAHLLIGSDGPGINPKLDNVRKGWRAASHNWVILADSNVLMPTDYISAMLSGWQDGVGLVCAPPIGTRALNFWAEVEAQYLNGYQARVQYAADSVGYGFAQGKSMLFNRPLLESWGGIDSLDADIAEDAAATKVVRRNGHRVQLAPQTFAQPLGRRSYRQVAARQYRWAQLRRCSFPLLYALEPLSMLWVALSGAGFAALAAELDLGAVLASVIVLWFLGEAMLARAAGWPRPSVAAWLAREMLAPIVWLRGWQSAPFTWRTPVGAPRSTVAQPA